MDDLTRHAVPDGIAVRLRTMRLFYLMAGIGISAWAITVPFTKIRFGLDDGTLGLILFAGGFGGVVAMPFCGPLIARFGSRRVLVTAGLAYGIVLLLLSVAPSIFWFTTLLFLYGLIFGAIDVAMNAQGAVIETRSGRRQMSFFHAMFSVGGLAAALATSFLLRIGLSNALCAGLCGLAIYLILSRGRHLLPAADDLPSHGPPLALPNRATVVLGLCCLACFLTEGVATDWSTIFLKFSRGMPVATAALGYAAFSLAMAGARMVGDRAAMRLGPAMVMRLGCWLAVAGFAMVIFLPYGPAGIVGFGLVGFGIGNIAPLVFSAAARVKGMTANHSVPAVVGLGYVGFLLGPVAIGLVAHAASLSAALGLDAALLFAIGFAADAVAH
jgi:MFS family permease